MCKSICINVIVFCISLFLFIFYSWLSTWTIMLGFVGLLLLSIGLILWKYKDIKFVFLSWFVLLLCSLLLTPNSISAYNLKTKEYLARIKKGDSLNFIEKTSIFGLNIFISAGGYLLFPEVSKESFYMVFKTNNTVRTFESDFFLNSKHIQKAIKNKQNRVSWKSSEYDIRNPEARYGLALNPCILKIKSMKAYTYYSVTVDVDYKCLESNAVLFACGQYSLMVEEGLFNYLQKEAWLHPYKAIWVAKVKNE